MRVHSMMMVAAVGLAALSGCSKGASEPQPGASQGNEAPPVPATGTVPLTKLSDGQIAGILAAVDDGEIQQAQLALKKAQDAETRHYADHMIEQHSASKQAMAQLASQTNIQPAESPKAKELQQKGDKMMSDLNAADANNFDITYIDGQIAQHAEVLDLIKNQMLPAVNDTALRDQLTNARGMVEQHLDQARKLKK